MFRRTLQRNQPQWPKPVSMEDAYGAIGHEKSYNTMTKMVGYMDYIGIEIMKYKWYVMGCFALYTFTGGLTAYHYIHSKPFTRVDSADIENTMRSLVPQAWFQRKTTDAVAIRKRFSNTMDSFHVVDEVDGVHQTECIGYNGVTHYADAYILSSPLVVGIDTTELFKFEEQKYATRMNQRNVKQQTIFKDHCLLFGQMFVRTRYYVAGDAGHGPTVQNQVENNLKREIQRRVQNRLLQDVPAADKATAAMILKGNHYIPKPISVAELFEDDASELMKTFGTLTVAQFDRKKYGEVFPAKEDKWTSGIKIRENTA